jgi:hypothetical protein
MKKTKKMTEGRLVVLLTRFFERLSIEGRLDCRGAKTFHEAMLLTSHKGVVVRFGKREFQVEVQDSTRH